VVRATGLFHATLVAWDLDRAERFYRDVLGIGRHATPSYFPDDVVFLDLGNTMVHLSRFGSALRRPDAPGASDELEGLDEAAFIERQKAVHLLRLHIAIETDDLDAALERVKAAGRPILQGPLTRADGMRCFYFADTEYNRVELVQH
jgi:catechol 2,3-dioxygenase-like lactoylglutathione lyase family enzyme